MRVSVPSYLGVDTGRNGGVVPAHHLKPEPPRRSKDSIYHRRRIHPDCSTPKAEPTTLLHPMIQAHSLQR